MLYAITTFLYKKIKMDIKNFKVLSDKSYVVFKNEPISFHQLYVVMSILHCSILKKHIF